MPTEITMWTARDGTSFDTEAFAIQYEIRLDLIEYIDENPIYSSGSQKINGKDFLEWIGDNPRIYIQLLPEVTSNELA